MKRAFLLLVLVTVVSAGCHFHSRPRAGSCGKCGGHGQYSEFRAQRQADHVPQIPPHHYRQVEPAGPPTGQYAYPYYTTRAPRDFLLSNPTTIGY